MSYMVITCTKCAHRKIISLLSRNIPHTTRCPYCGAYINVKEAHFKIFDDYSRARSYWLAGNHRTLDRWQQ